jgi:MFS transporter, DHA2 family, multidrug resistance protein
MNTGATPVGAPATASGAAANPWAIAVLVALATFMEVLDTTIANVALRYIAGGLGVSEDEVSWVVTTYLVANAVSLTLDMLIFASRRQCLCVGSARGAILCGRRSHLDRIAAGGEPTLLIAATLAFQEQPDRDRRECPREAV